jgi:hypothetical protein
MSQEATETVYFNFEEDFVEDNVRCIPMIVRFKLDACGIKLKLSEWSKMLVAERKILAELVCDSNEDILNYRDYISQVIFKRTGNEATDLPIELNPDWANNHAVPQLLQEKLQEFNGSISLQQWYTLNDLQRFVLIKLCKPGHENRNFPKAAREFGLI